MKTLREQYAAARKAAQDIHAKAVAENRDKTDEEQTEFDDHVAKAEQLKVRIDKADASSAALANLADLIDLDDDDLDEPVITVRGKAKRMTPGERFIDSAEFQSVAAPYKAMEKVPNGTNVKVNPVKIGGFKDALLTDPELYTVPRKWAPPELEIVDLFGALNVIEDAPKTIQIDRESFTNHAGIYIEGSDATKAESTITFTSDEVTLAVIAHHINVTTQALKYNSLLRSRIDTRLINGVLVKAQSEVAATLAAEVGLMQTQAFDTDLATTIRKAVTKAQRGILTIGGSAVIRMLISPEDHETLDLEMLAAMVALAGQELTQTARIWRTEIVPLFGLPQGVAYVGDTKQIDFYVGSGGVTVSTGWVDKQFIQNRLTILAEMEAKAAVIGGAALVATDLDSDTPPNFS